MPKTKRSDPTAIEQLVEDGRSSWNVLLYSWLQQRHFHCRVQSFDPPGDKPNFYAQKLENSWIIVLFPPPKILFDTRRYEPWQLFWWRKNWSTSLIFCIVGYLLWNDITCDKSMFLCHANFWSFRNWTGEVHNQNWISLGSNWMRCFARDFVESVATNGSPFRSE